MHNKQIDLAVVLHALDVDFLAAVSYSLHSRCVHFPREVLRIREFEFLFHFLQAAVAAAMVLMSFHFDFQRCLYHLIGYHCYSVDLKDRCPTNSSSSELLSSDESMLVVSLSFCNDARCLRG